MNTHIYALKRQYGTSLFMTWLKWTSGLRLRASDDVDGCMTIALPAPETGLEIVFAPRLNVKNRFQDCFNVPAEIKPAFQSIIKKEIRGGLVP